VGKGNGIYKGKRLFECQKGHASLVPLEGLYREEDWDARFNEIFLCDTPPPPPLEFGAYASFQQNFLYFIYAPSRFRWRTVIFY